MTEKQPIYVLSEDSQRTIGRDAQRNNILAGKVIAETVRTTLGPKGMDKMLVDSMNDVVITNDGITILEEMKIEHPAAKMIIEAAKTQENEIGDGTTTVVVLIGELLKKAESLLDNNIHPTVISKGYRLAADRAQEILKEISKEVRLEDEQILKNIAETAMTGKGAEAAKEKLSKLCVEAIKYVIEENLEVDLDNIKLEKKSGGGIEDSELIQGMILDKEKAHPGMPKKIVNARVALLDLALEIKSTEIDAKIQITDPSQLQAFIDQEEKMLKDMVRRVVESGAQAIFCQKGIDDLAQHFLAKMGIYAVRRVKQSDMKKLQRATGARIINNLKELRQEDLGRAGLVEEKKVGNEEMTFITKCDNPKAVTLLIRGGTDHVIDEIERAVKDALGDITASIKEGKVVAGAGSTEIEVSRKLKEFANSLSGREQLAALAFSEAIEIIPKTLAENAGLDPIDMLTELKARHDNNEITAGIDVFAGKIVDSWEQGVIEPLKVKTQAIKSAAEVTELILRIDDVIASKGSSDGMSPQGMPPGMM